MRNGSAPIVPGALCNGLAQNKISKKEHYDPGTNCLK